MFWEAGQVVFWSICKFLHLVCRSDDRVQKHTLFNNVERRRILKKITYYLWRNSFSSQEAYEKAKARLSDMGFRVVTFTDGPDSRPLWEAVRAVIENHM